MNFKVFSIKITFLDSDKISRKGYKWWSNFWLFLNFIKAFLMSLNSLTWSILEFIKDVNILYIYPVNSG